MAVDKYTGRSNGFELCVVPLKARPYEVDVLGVELHMPAGQGLAMFLRYERECTSILIEKPQRVGAQAIAERLVYSINRALHGPVVMTKADAGDDIAQFDRFSTEMEASRERLNKWRGIVSGLVSEALTMMED